MLLDVLVNFFLLFFCINHLQTYQTHVAPCWEVAIWIVNVGNSTTHSSSKVAARLGQAHHGTASHVFATMVTETFDDCQGTRVADAETLASLTTEEGLTSGGSIQTDVTDNNVFFWNKTTSNDFWGWEDGNLSSREALACVVIGVTLHCHGNTLGQGEAHTLTTVSLKFDLDGIVRKTVLTVLCGYIVRQHSSRCAIEVGDFALDKNLLASFQRGFSQGNKFIVLSMIQSMVLSGQVADTRRGVEFRGWSQKWAQVQAATLVVLTAGIDLKILCLTNHFFHSAVTKLGHDLTDLVCHEHEVVDDMLWLT
mmetsp:Transcript_27113/g.45199  ORF Transcript_27113/g.45199 Transcript_27113/m.45199 type:complete len:309 (-) Transcript_27113:926-1852(-)